MCRGIAPVNGLADGQDHGLILFVHTVVTQARVVVFAEVVVAAEVARQLRAFEFLAVRDDDPPLNRLAAIGVDRVGDVGVQPRAAVVTLDGPVFVESRSAFVAEAGAKMILGGALRTAIGQLAAGHRDERAARSLNDLQVADHEAAVEGDRTERLQPVVGIVHELDANLGDLHGCTPLNRSRRRQIPAGATLNVNGSNPGCLPRLRQTSRHDRPSHGPHRAT